MKNVTCSHESKLIKSLSFTFANAYYDPYKFYNRYWGINDIYLQELWYLSSNILRWFLSTITARAPGPEQSQSYRQSLSEDFYVKKFWRLICAFSCQCHFTKMQSLSVEICKTTSGRDMLDKHNEDCIGLFLFWSFWHHIIQIFNFFFFSYDRCYRKIPLSIK